MFVWTPSTRGIAVRETTCNIVYHSGSKYHRRPALIEVAAFVCFSWGRFPLQNGLGFFLQMDRKKRGLASFFFSSGTLS